MILGLMATKGNVGRTELTRSLAAYKVERGEDVFVYEFDVSNPKLIEYFPWDSDVVRRQVSKVDVSKCTLAGKCISACRFGAIEKVGEKLVRHPHFCRGCGHCKEVCPQGAIYFDEIEAGEVGSGRADKISFFAARLAPREAWEGLLIKRLKETYPIEGGPAILKAPLGLGAMSLRAVKDASSLYLVTRAHEGVEREINTFGQIVQGFDIPGAVIWRGKEVPEGVQKAAEGYGLKTLVLSVVPELGGTTRQEEEGTLEEIWNLGGGERK